MNRRDAIEKAEEILGKHRMPMMADAWRQLRDDIADALVAAATGAAQ